MAYLARYSAYWMSSISCRSHFSYSFGITSFRCPRMMARKAFGGRPGPATGCAGGPAQSAPPLGCGFKEGVFLPCLLACVFGRCDRFFFAGTVGQYPDFGLPLTL